MYVYKEYIHFDDWRSFEKFLNLDGFVYKFDLKSAYHHIDIFPSHQSFLSFSWHAKYYMFTSLPFGLVSAPFICTEVFHRLISYWHSYGIKMCLYLDDGVGITKTYDLAKQQSGFVRKTLLKVKLTCNDENLHGSPVKVLRG